MEHLITDDIFRTASLLCLGAELAEVQRSGQHITFLVEGVDVRQADLRYRTGKARVNPLQLKENVQLLRDLINEHLQLTTKGRTHARHHVPAA